MVDEAVVKGHMEVLRWARKNGCSWSEYAKNRAKAQLGYTDEYGNLARRSDDEFSAGDDLSEDEDGWETASSDEYSDDGEEGEESGRSLDGRSEEEGGEEESEDYSEEEEEEEEEEYDRGEHPEEYVELSSEEE